MEGNEIKTPNDILLFMNKNINYGWCDYEGKTHFGEMDNFRRLFRISSTEMVLETHLGTCIEQVYLMKQLLDKLKIPNKMFCTRLYESDDFDNLDEPEHMHCFILYYLDGKVHQIEHPNFNRRGIYHFDSEDEAISKINEIYIEMSGGSPRPVTEFFEVTPGLTFKEFNNYINSLDKKYGVR